MYINVLYNIVTDMYNNIYRGYTRLNTEPTTSINITDDLNSNTNVKSVGVQTNFIYYTSFGSLSDDSISLNINYDDHYFKHLAFANQTYFEHFKDSIKYSWISFKSSFYFLCHAFWPDSYVKNGSDTIHALSETIYDKYTKRISEIINNNND